MEQEKRSKPLRREDVFSDETWAALLELGKILRNVRIKMKTQGFDIVSGKVVSMSPSEHQKCKTGERSRL